MAIHFKCNLSDSFKNTLNAFHMKFLEKWLDCVSKTTHYCRGNWTKYLISKKKQKLEFLLHNLRTLLMFSWIKLFKIFPLISFFFLLFSARGLFIFIKIIKPIPPEKTFFQFKPKIKSPFKNPHRLPPS